MGGNRFFDLLHSEVLRAETLLCVGLDPSLDIPTADVLPRMRSVVEATHPYACAFKPNAAFYEARGAAGWQALRSLIDVIHSYGKPVLLDAKRGDIASTADAYARACFDELDADAITASPFLGRDSVESFSSRADRGVFLLCHTSNPGARDLQELDAGGQPLYERIAGMAATWSAHGNIGLVVGATYPETLARVRAAAPGLWVLLPGVGSQGGDLDASLAAGLDVQGSRVLVNVSRAVAQAADPGKAADEYRRRINAARNGQAEHGQADHRRALRGTAGSTTRVLQEQPVAGESDSPDAIALGLHDIGAIRFGDFTLKSGKKSPLYIDLRLLVSDPRVMARAASAMAALLAGLRFDRIAALPYGGLPIGQAVSLASGRPLIYPRREAKDYGTKKLIEGTFAAGETVVVLDDLVTTGDSKIEAMLPLTEAGLKVTDVVVLVDREQGGRAELASRGLALHSVLTLSQLLDCLVRHGRVDAAVRTDVREALALT
jgi:uridine monophosphate synthetase